MGGGSLGENGYMNIYGQVPLLSTWDYHNIVNWLYPNTKKKKKVEGGKNRGRKEHSSEGVLPKIQVHEILKLT